MTTPATTLPREPAPPQPAAAARPPAKRRSARTPLHAIGEPKLWLTGGALALCIFMIIGLLVLIFIEGIQTFWPVRVVQINTHTQSAVMGEVSRTESYRPGDDDLEKLPAEVREEARKSLDASGGSADRRLVRTGNFEVSGSHFTEISNLNVKDESFPRWALVIETLSAGRLYGTPAAFLERSDQKKDGEADVWEPTTEDPDEVWQNFQNYHGEARRRWEKRQELEKHDLAALTRKQEEARLDVRRAELKHSRDSDEYKKAADVYEEVKEQTNEQSSKIRAEIAELDRENARLKLRVQTADGKTMDVSLASIVRAYPANQLTFSGKLGVYLSRWGEFLSDDPRGDGSEGGVWPAIWGTVVMTILMSAVVVPFGVVAALYLREYAKYGPIVSAVRIAMNNLAGVPSIVFGVFGLGFFCYLIGGGIDSWLFEAQKPNPTFGTGGLLWASFTLALLTLPVVIVTTEEALAAVPNSLREGSYGCGASKWQTIWRIVLPRAMPGILTGMILAMSRGAGEVAPLMIVGAMKDAVSLPIDSVFPYVHPQRSFMHLGYHIFDVGFHSKNSEAGKPMMFTTTLLLIVIVAALNLSAVLVRARLKRRHAGGKFQ